MRDPINLFSRAHTHPRGPQWFLILGLSLARGAGAQGGSCERELGVWEQVSMLGGVDSELARGTQEQEARPQMASPQIVWAVWAVFPVLVRTCI